MIGQLSNGVAAIDPQRAHFDAEAIAHLDALRSFALKLTRAADDADDLVSDTMLRAFQRWEQYRLGTNIRAWLFRIVRNSSINRYRKETREPGTEIAPGWTCRLCAGAGLVPGD